MRRRRTVNRPSQNLTNAHGEYRIYGLLPGDYLDLLGSAAAGGAGRCEPCGVRVGQRRRWPTAAAGPRVYLRTDDVSRHHGRVRRCRGDARSRRGTARRGLLSPVRSGGARQWGRHRTGWAARFRRRHFLLRRKTRIRCCRRQVFPFRDLGADGSFACPQLTPGPYTLAARGGAVASPNEAARVSAGLAQAPLWGLVDVVVAGKDLSNIAIRLQTPMSVSGQAVLSRSATSATADLTRFQVRLAPALGAPPISARASAPVGADGAFRSDSVGPGPYRFTATAPAGWSLRSAMLNGKDIADVPVRHGSRRERLGSPRDLHR